MKFIFLSVVIFQLGFAGLMYQDSKVHKVFNFNDADNYCKNLVLSGKNDWKLPTNKELLKITDKKKFNPSLKYMKNVKPYWYWTSQSSSANPQKAWSVNFKDGALRDLKKTHKLYVRCVRSNEVPLFQQIVTKVTKQELQSIKKPPRAVKVTRGEFETTVEFNQRVSKTKKKQKLLVAKYKSDYNARKISVKPYAMKKALEITWGKPILNNIKYDADNGFFISDVSFERKKDFTKKVAIKIKRKFARSFKRDFKKIKPKAVFEYTNKGLKLKDITMAYRGVEYLAQFTSLNLESTRLAVNLENDFNVDPNINSAITVADNADNGFDPNTLVNTHELDDLLKKSKSVEKDKTKWLFVVGIENYDFTDNISFAKRSADMFIQVAQKKLGVIKNGHSYVMLNSDASQARIKANMKKMLRKVKPGDTIYFYYNGHGVPVPNLNNEPFMLTADTEPDFVADDKYFSLQNIYNKLSNSKAAKVVAVVDSCFTGVTDNKSVLKGVAATKMVAKSVSFNKEKMVVLSAGKSHEYSNGYNQKKHRLFSFYIMKNIIEGKTNINELHNSTKNSTYQTSIENYGDSRTQSPTKNGNVGSLL